VGQIPEIALVRQFVIKLLWTLFGGRLAYDIRINRLSKLPNLLLAIGRNRLSPHYEGPCAPLGREKTGIRRKLPLGALAEPFSTSIRQKLRWLMTDFTSANSPSRSGSPRFFSDSVILIFIECKNSTTKSSRGRQIILQTSQVSYVPLQLPLSTRME
jgi:hypothetical protein